MKHSQMKYPIKPSEAIAKHIYSIMKKAVGNFSSSLLLISQLMLAIHMQIPVVGERTADFTGLLLMCLFL